MATAAPDASKAMLHRLKPERFAWTLGGSGGSGFSGGCDLAAQVTGTCVFRQNHRPNVLLDAGEWLILRGDVDVLDHCSDIQFRRLYLPLGTWEASDD